MKFKKDQKVAKVSGYAFDGVVRSVFRTGAGKRRLVVEMDDRRGWPSGLLHIFNDEQLKSR